MKNQWKRRQAASIQGVRFSFRFQHPHVGRAFAILFLALFCSHARAQITIVTTPVEGAIFEVKSAEEVVHFHLTTKGDAAVKVTVALADIVGPNGERQKGKIVVNDKLDENSFNFEATKHPKVDISGNWPRLGEYRTELTITSNGIPQVPIPIKVLRKAASPPAVTWTMDARTATVWPWGGDATIPLNIRSSNGLRLDCYLPRIDSLTLDETDKTKMQASYDDIVFDGISQTNVSRSNSFRIDPAGGGTFRVIGLKDGGTYTATVTIASEDGFSMSKEVRLFVKHNALVALVWIAAGCWLSFWLLTYRKQTRPMLVGLRDLAGEQFLLEALIEKAMPLDEAEDRAVTALKWQHWEIARKIRNGATGDDIKNWIANARSRLDNFKDWLVLGRRLKSISPQRLTASATARWNALVDSYFAKSAPSVKFEDELKAVGQDLSESLVEFLNGFIAAIGNDEKLSPIKKALTRITELAQAKNWSKAFVELDKARLQYVQVQGDIFTNKVGPMPVPLGFAADEWNAFKMEILDQLGSLAKVVDPDAAERRYRDLCGCYFAQLIDRLAGVLKKVNPAGLSQAQGASLHAAIQQLELAKSNVRAENWKAAESTYEAAARDARPFLSPEEPAVVDEIPTFLPSYEEGVKSNPEVAKLQPPAAYEKLLTRFDHGAELIVMAVAIVVGFLSLWVMPLAWGGWKDYMVAFLWGFGIQGGATGLASYVGFETVQKKVQP